MYSTLPITRRYTCGTPQLASIEKRQFKEGKGESVGMTVGDQGRLKHGDFQGFMRLYTSPLLHLSELLANVFCFGCYDGMWENGSGAWI